MAELGAHNASVGGSSPPRSTRRQDRKERGMTEKKLPWTEVEVTKAHLEKAREYNENTKHLYGEQDLIHESISLALQDLAGKHSVLFPSKSAEVILTSRRSMKTSRDRLNHRIIFNIEIDEETHKLLHPSCLLGKVIRDSVKELFPFKMEIRDHPVLSGSLNFNDKTKVTTIEFRSSQKDVRKKLQKKLEKITNKNWTVVVEERATGGGLEAVFNDFDRLMKVVVRTYGQSPYGYAGVQNQLFRFNMPRDLLA